MTLPPDDLRKRWIQLEAQLAAALAPTLLSEVQSPARRRLGTENSKWNALHWSVGKRCMELLSPLTQQSISQWVEQKTPRKVTTQNPEYAPILERPDCVEALIQWATPPASSSTYLSVPTPPSSPPPGMVRVFKSRANWDDPDLSSSHRKPDPLLEAQKWVQTGSVPRKPNR